VRGVQRLEVGVALVLRVARAVVGERRDLAVGLRHPAEAAPVAVAAVLVLVEVVAEVEHRVEVGAARDGRVGVEVALGQVRARRHGEAQPRGRTHRERASASQRRSVIERPEAVVPGAARLETGGVHLDGEVALDARRGAPLGHDVAQGRIPRDPPRDAHGVGLARRRRHAGPHDHPVGQWIAGGDAVAERDLAIFPDLVGSRATRARHAEERRRGRAAQQVAAREVHGRHAAFSSSVARRGPS